MAEQPTVTEKLEEMYQRQLGFMDQQMKLAAEHHKDEFERERQNHLEQRKLQQVEFDERRQELIRQNDGMLGAIGRLHSENEILRKKLQEAETKHKEHLERAEFQARAIEQTLEVKHREEAAKMATIKEEAAQKIKQLEATIATLKARAAKK